MRVPKVETPQLVYLPSISLDTLAVDAITGKIKNLVQK